MGGFRRVERGAEKPREKVDIVAGFCEKGGSYC
jgi:hypothetical protein